MTVSEHAALRHEIVGHEVVADYVVYIVDIWEGDRGDPAVEVIRHTGIWRGDDLVDEEDNAIDPDFSTAKAVTYRYTNEWTGKGPEPLMWDALDIPKKADRSAKNHKAEALKWEDPEAYVGWNQNRKHELYIKFLDAIDTLSRDDSDEEAWAVVAEYREHSALLYEK